MRIPRLALAAAAAAALAAAAAALILLTPAEAPAPVPGPEGGSAPSGPHPPGSSDPPAPGPPAGARQASGSSSLPGGRGRSPLPGKADPVLRDPDAPGRRPPGPPPEGGAGEVVREGLPEAEAAKVDAARLKLAEANLQKLVWRGKPLAAVAAEIAEKSGVPVELSGEGLAEEPVTYRLEEEESTLEVLRAVALQRNLRFEITAEKVIVKR